MKQRFLTTIALFLIIVPIGYGEDVIKFEDYKKLSQEDRQKTANEATPDLQRQYGRWNQILSMRGAWWEPSHQGRAFIRSKGHTALYDLSDYQVNLWGKFEQEATEANRKSGMTKEDQGAVFSSLEADFALIDKDRYKDQWWYLVKLAPTPEAQALNEKAAALEAEWNKHFGNGQYITREELRIVDSAVKEIRDQMRELPQLTPEQLEAGLAALPEEIPHR